MSKVSLLEDISFLYQKFLNIPLSTYCLYYQERIERPAANGGAPCSGSSTRECDLGPCQDCQWSNWGPCDASCGDGTQQRSIVQPAELGGKPCEGNDTQSCSLKPCPIDCQWSDWSSCDASCGDGMEQRTILQPAEHGGKPCEGDATRPCNLKACPMTSKL